MQHYLWDNMEHSDDLLNHELNMSGIDLKIQSPVNDGFMMS